MPNWFFYGLGAMLCWGFWGFFGKLATNAKLNPFVLAFTGAVVTAAALAVLVGTQRLSFAAERPAYFYAVLLGLITAAGSGLSYLAFSQGPISRVAPLTSLYPAVPALLGWLVLKENLSWTNALGIVLAMFSGYLITSK